MIHDCNCMQHTFMNKSWTEQVAPQTRFSLIEWLGLRIMAGTWDCGRCKNVITLRENILNVHHFALIKTVTTILVKYMYDCNTLWITNNDLGSNTAVEITSNQITYVYTIDFRFDKLFINDDMGNWDKFVSSFIYFWIFINPTFTQESLMDTGASDTPSFSCSVAVLELKYLTGSLLFCIKAQLLTVMHLK